MTCDYQHLPHLGIQNLKPYVPGKSVEELAKEKAITNIIKLASNENPYGCSPLVRKALAKMSSELISSYPNPGIHPLRQKLSSSLGLEKEMLIFCNGSDLLFSLLLIIFGLHRSKYMLTHEKSFSTYAIQAQTLGIPCKFSALKPDWTVDIDAMLKACDSDISIVFIANPNNPTGGLIAEKDLKRFLTNISPEIIVVIDEAYYDYAYPSSSPGAISLLKHFPNLVISRTFSKVYGLAGLRLGYALSQPAIINLIQKVQPPFSVNQAALFTAQVALEDTGFINKSLEMNALGKDYLSRELKSLGLELLPINGNFITFDCKKDSLPIYNALLDKGIIVRPLHPYDLTRHLRVTIGRPEQNARFISEFKNLI